MMPLKGVKRRGPPDLPWDYGHRLATRHAIEWHLGIGKHLACYAPNSLPCSVHDANRYGVKDYPAKAKSALKRMADGYVSLSLPQMDACLLALNHVIRHPHPDSLSPWVAAEAGQFLEQWMRDYDRRT